MNLCKTLHNMYKSFNFGQHFYTTLHKCTKLIQLYTILQHCTQIHKTHKTAHNFTTYDNTIHTTLQHKVYKSLPELLQNCTRLFLFFGIDKLIRFQNCSQFEKTTHMSTTLYTTSQQIQKYKHV